MSSIIFNGSSRYSNDLAAVIDRALAIASLPLKQMEQARQATQNQTTAVSTLNARVSALQSTLTRLSGTTTTKALESTSSDPSSVLPTFTAGAGEGQYLLNVTSLGSFTTFAVDSFAGVTDPNEEVFTTAGSQSIQIGAGPAITLTPSDASLQALVDEINKKAGDKVRAAIVNVSSTSTPSYSVSLQAKSLGATDITLSDGARSATNAAAQRGALLQYDLNGASLTSASRSITIAPGVTAQLLQVTSSTVTVSAQRTTNAFKTSIQDFISAFNGVVSEIDRHRADRSSPLAGGSVLTSVLQTLTRAINFEGGSGKITSLALSGVEFTQTGMLTLNNEVWNRSAEGNLTDLNALLGDREGGGLLNALTDAVDSLVEADTGLLSSVIDTSKESFAAQTARMEREQARIDRLEEDLQARMAEADAMIAMLEQQATYFTNMFEAMRANQKSYS